MIKSISYFLVCLLVCTAFFSCEVNRDGYASRPVKGLLHPDAELPDVETIIYHLNDSVSRIYLKIANDRLLYKRPDTSKVFFAQLRISCNIMPVDHPRILSDSEAVLLSDRSENEIVPFRQLVTYADVKARLGLNYDLDIMIRDLNRHVKYRKSLQVIKENKTGQQNFLFRKNDTVMFRNWFLPGQDIVMNYTYPQDELVTVQYFRTEQGPALPPFSARTPDETRPAGDTLGYLELRNGKADIRMPPGGFLYLRAQKTVREGVSIFTVNEGFPGLSTTEEMIRSTRYVMSKDEFESCLDAADPKAAIDEFWLNIGGSRERAREMVRKYYGRVTEANKNYSSYMAGWKTDRGMIYIVMGTPTRIFKTRELETWVYGSETSANALRFVFVKPTNAIGENDLVLERSSYYRDPYHMAVEYWRQGVVYNDQR